MVPLTLRRSPLSFMSTLRPEISAPLPSMSPGLTRTYTCGTNTRWVLPSGRVTVCSTSQTMSLVKRSPVTAIVPTLNEPPVLSMRGVFSAISPPA